MMLEETGCPVCQQPVLIQFDSDENRQWVGGVYKQCGCPVVVNEATGQLRAEEPE